jgi:hypothetical protein
MIRRLGFASVLLLLTMTAGAAWSTEPAGGGCQLPDLAGMTPDQIQLAALAAGFETAPAPAQAATPLCPVTFHCNSIGNCAAGPLCSLTDIGSCCAAGSGLVLCCTSGTIKVTRCPCRCTSPHCSASCSANNEVNWGCS